MDSELRLNELLDTPETTHLEELDAILEGLRWIDAVYGWCMRWEPEVEVARAVIAALCVFMQPNDLKHDVKEEEETLRVKEEEENFRRLVLQAVATYSARCDERGVMRAARRAEADRERPHWEAG